MVDVKKNAVPIWLISLLMFLLLGFYFAGVNGVVTAGLAYLVGSGASLLLGVFLKRRKAGLVGGIAKR